PAGGQFHERGTMVPGFRTRWPATGRSRTLANNKYARSCREAIGRDLDTSPVHAPPPSASPSVLHDHPSLLPAPVLIAPGRGDQQRLPVLPHPRCFALRDRRAAAVCDE